MGGYTCPSQCGVDHSHYSKDKDYSFMEYLVKSDSTTITYTYLNKKVENEWVYSW